MGSYPRDFLHHHYHRRLGNFLCCISLLKGRAPNKCMMYVQHVVLCCVMLYYMLCRIM